MKNKDKIIRMALPTNEPVKKIGLGVNYGQALQKMAFPGNPFLIHRIRDAILALSGNDLLSNTVREAARNKKLKGAINLIRECSIDNKRMALEIFGNELVSDVLEYWEDNKPAQTEQVSDIPEGLFQSPGLFGYMGDN